MNTYLCKKKKKIKLNYHTIKLQVPFKIKLILNRLSLRYNVNVLPSTFINFFPYIHISKKQMQLKSVLPTFFHASTSISTIHIFQRVTGSLIPCHYFLFFFSSPFFFFSLSPLLNASSHPRIRSTHGRQTEHRVELR